MTNNPSLTLVPRPADPAPTDAAPDGPPGRLGPDREGDLFRRMEAGVLAGAILDGDLPRLADATDVELAALVSDGRRAREALVAAHSGLVWFVVLPIARRTGLSRDELAQDGMVGLLEALDRFDHRRGSFASIALPRIRMRVWDAAVTVHGTLGLPPRRARQWRLTRSVEADLAVRLARRPDDGEVAEASGQPLATVRSLRAFQPPCGLDEALPVASPDEVALQGQEGAITGMLHRLTRADRELLAHLYGLGGRPAMTPAQAADALGISLSTVRRRERAALGLLRAGLADREAA